MTKKVNIYPKTPILSIRPPIRSVTKKVTKSEEEIKACIIARATVEEVLSDGSVVRLDLTNYNKDNTPANTLSDKKDDNKKSKESTTDNTEKSVEEPKQFTYNNRYGKNKKKNKYYQPSKITETVSKEESAESKSDAVVVEATVPAKVTTTEDTPVETIDVDTIV